MRLLETQTTVKDPDGAIIDLYNETKTHYTLAELRDAHEVDSNAYQKALEWIAEGNTMFDWWENVLDFSLEDVQAKYGITYVPKNVCFDLDRADYLSFGTRAYISDAKVFLKRAGIDLRTKVGRHLLDDPPGLAVNSWAHNPYTQLDVDYYDDDPSDDQKETLREVLRDAIYFLKKALHDEMDYLYSEEAALDMAEANDWYFDEHGSIV